jgi:predicted phosphodiesterase
MLSDIQPKTLSGRRVFEQVVSDSVEAVPNIDVAVIAGDMLQARSQAEAFEWFFSARKQSPVRNWYEIAGNHDVRSGSVYRKYVSKPAYYGVRVGNILLLMLSDESTDSRTDISSEAFAWWRDMVKNNQENIIITVTHAQLRHSGLFGSFVPSRIIFDSERFESVLQEEKVAIWASGHSHLPHGMWGTFSIEKKLGGTCFVNVSAIRKDGFMDSQSRFLIFEEGSDIVWIRSRNHTKRCFDSGLDIPLKLNRPFLWDGSRPCVLAPSR